MDTENLVEGYEDSQEHLTFHYNRADRIAHAPQNVKDYYSGKMQVKAPGLIKALVATKTNRMIFMGLVVFVAVVFMQGLFGNKPYRKNVDGIPMELKASEINGQVISTLIFEKNIKKYDYSKGVIFTADIEYLDESDTLLSKDFFTSDEKTEILYNGEKLVLRTNTEGYDIIKKVRVYVSLNEKKVDLIAAVEQR